MIVLGRKRIAQQSVDALPGGEHLRALHLLRNTARRVENLARGDGDTERVDGQAERAQPRDQLLLGDDAGAAPG